MRLRVSWLTIGLAAVAAVALVACAVDIQARMQGEIDGLLPEGARKSGECNWASGFVENAPASLACRYLLDGDLASVGRMMAERLHARGYAFQPAERASGAPTAWLVAGRNSDYFASIGLVAPGDPLDWQLNETPVPPATVGIFVHVTERR